jgi:hypothetical protein
VKRLQTHALLPTNTLHPNTILLETIYSPPDMSSTYPTHEELIATNPQSVSVSIDFMRLRWFLSKDDPPSAIAVVQDATDENSTQESYSPTHPISQLSLTTPPVSAITVSMDVLDEYAGEWVSVHSEHADPEDDCPDHDGARFDAEGEVDYCCNQDRPGPGPQIGVVAKQPGHFVTIGDYVETVHPWLRSLDSQLRAAAGVVSCWPLDPAVPICVWPTSASPLRVHGYEGMTPDNWAYQWKLLAKTARNTFQVRSEGEVASA